MSGIQQSFGFMRSAAVVVGQQAYTTPGTYSWVAPTGVTSVSVVAVGGGATGSPACGCYSGAGGKGGSLAYKNNYSVTPGNSYSVVVGSTNNFSSFVNSSTLKAGGAICGNVYVGCGGGYGGTRGSASNGYAGGGGGAGGYSGLGGNGSNGINGGSNGAGGGGGGGSSSSGGGVGIFGQGSSGNGGSYGRYAGLGGSGGSNGTCFSGGSYGGGGRGNSFNLNPGTGASGAVRIIYPGNTRLFPSTCTANK